MHNREKQEVLLIRKLNNISKKKKRLRCALTGGTRIYIYCAIAMSNDQGRVLLKDAAGKMKQPVTVHNSNCTFLNLCALCAYFEFNCLI